MIEERKLKETKFEKYQQEQPSEKSIKEIRKTKSKNGQEARGRRKTTEREAVTRNNMTEYIYFRVFYLHFIYIYKKANLRVIKGIIDRKNVK